MFSFKPMNIKRVLNSILAAEKAKRNVLDIMDEGLYRGWRLTQNIAWTPYLTGLLMSMIVVAQSKYVSPTTAIGALVVIRIEYGRRQEFEHKEKGYYLFRAIQESELYVISKLNQFKKVFVPGNVTLKEADDRFRRNAAPTEINLVEGDLS